MEDGFALPKAFFALPAFALLSYNQDIAHHSNQELVFS
jgi:hypothetical protein